MSLMHVPLDQIDETHLRALIASGSAESHTIDYKRASYGNADADYSEFLADISSFANSSGGDLLIGIDAKNGIPDTLTPLAIPLDPEILRLEQAARGGLQPRMELVFRAVPIKDGGQILIIRIPRSYGSPHRVSRHGRNRFWVRSSAGKYEPDVDELRRLFNAGPLLADRIRDFRADRVTKIATGHAPVQLMNQGTLLLHFVPLAAFDGGSSLPLREVEQNFRSFVPIGSSTAVQCRINFDGVLKTSNADQRATQQRAYVQVYRNGIVETAHSTLIAVRFGSPIISNLDDQLIFEAMRTLKDLAKVGINPPYALLVTLIGVLNAQINFARGIGAPWLDALGTPLDRDQYFFHEVIFETIPSTPAECAKVIRPILDQIANAGGVASSLIFDDLGDYLPLAG